MVINGAASDWAPVTSGVPQGSVLGPLLFVVYINDIDLGLKFIAKFADDTKIGNSLLSDRGRQSLQEDLRKISAWSDKWEMPFNVNKCHILQVGTINNKYEYEMGGVKLESVHCGSKILVLGSRQISNFPSTAKRQHVNPIKCWALLTEIFPLRIKI